MGHLKCSMLISLIFSCLMSSVNAQIICSPIDKKKSVETSFVINILEELMVVIEAKEVNVNISAEKIGNIISRNFAFNSMVKDILGDNANIFNNKEINKFEEMFKIIFRDCYTRQVLNFFKICEINVEDMGYNKNNKNIRIIKTVFCRPNENIDVEYEIINIDNKYLISDVIVDGVSILNNFKDEFNREINMKGKKSLLNKMNIMVNALKQE